MKKFDCSCIGRICIDHIALVKTFPKKNSKVPILNYKTEIGGQSAISAIALSRLGLKVNILSVVGNDDNGRLALKILQKENVYTKNVIKTKKTPLAFIWTEKTSAKRTILYQKLNTKILFHKKTVIYTIKNSDFVLVDHQGIKYTIPFLKHFKKYNTKIIFDAERLNNDVIKFLPYIDYLICSEDFILEYKKHFKLKTVSDTIKKLFFYGPKIVCGTFGEKGSLAVFQNKFYFSKSIKVQAIDTTGAGDVFHSGFIFGLVQKWDIKNILKFANFVAGKSCTSLGGVEKIPYFRHLPKSYKKLCRKN